MHSFVRGAAMYFAIRSEIKWHTYVNTDIVNLSCLVASLRLRRGKNGVVSPIPKSNTMPRVHRV